MPTLRVTRPRPRLSAASGSAARHNPETYRPRRFRRLCARTYAPKSPDHALPSSKVLTRTGVPERSSLGEYSSVIPMSFTRIAEPILDAEERFEGFETLM